MKTGTATRSDFNNQRDILQPSTASSSGQCTLLAAA